jgi:AraC-like DNA-binding protein
MSKIQVVSAECDIGERSLPEWGDALRKHVGQSPLPELTRCVSIGKQRFAGRIEFATLDHAVLSRVATTPYIQTRSLRGPNPGAPPLLIALLSGIGRVEQPNRSCTLHAGEWCLFDPLQPFEASPFGMRNMRNEYLALTLERPSDPERLGLLEQGAARRCNAKTGMSRTLLATLTEGFNQLNRLGPSSRKKLERALTEMVWDAVREQLEAQSAGVHRDVLCARIKSYVERKIADPELSVDAIAQALGISTRSVHRAFEADPAGSISNYVWMRRLSHCAASLRDPTQTDRSITDICFSFGFKSTSHFAHMFKEHRGVPPREYRTAFAHA